jgi:cytochrome P450
MNLLDTYIYTQLKEGPNSKISNTELLAQFTTVLHIGTDTSSIFSSFIFYHLAKYPEHA